MFGITEEGRWRNSLYTSFAGFEVSENGLNTASVTPGNVDAIDIRISARFGIPE